MHSRMGSRQDNICQACHRQDKCIFTKKMQDDVHFCLLRDSFMCRLSNFLNASLLQTHHACQQSHLSVAPLAAWVSIASGASSYFSAFAANTFCQSATAMSHLSSAGCQLLQDLHGFIPPDLVWFNVVLLTSLMFLFPEFAILGTHSVLSFPVVFLLDAQMGGVWSVCSPRV